ncbi:porin, partial [Parasutterella excrementihominis]
MKNLHLLAISVGMSIGSAAMAEPSVTLYGILDGGVSVSKLQHQSAKVQMTNGNWLSNRWGLMGQEDLGGGNSVFFKLEQGFNLSNGSEATAGKAFNRETALGLSGEWGKLGLGRFGGLSSDCGTFSILGGAAYSTSFSTIGNMHGAFYLTDRYNNSVAYVTPDFVGLQGHLMYSNGTDSDEEKWSQNSHYYGAGLTYNKDKLSVDVIYELLDHKGAVDQDKTRLLNLGASYDFGAFKLFGAYEYAQHAALPGIEFAEEKMSEAYNAGKA